MQKDDVIYRQAAIDAIEQLDIPEDMCVFEILSHIELAIGTLPSAQQWHTGEPKEDGDYLCYKYGDDDGFGYFYVDTFYTHNGTVEYGTPLAYKGWQSCNHVKYWMQIPKLQEVEE